MEVNIELAKKLLKEKYFINGDNGIRTQHPIRVEDLAFIMQKYTDQQLSIHVVVGSYAIVRWHENNHEDVVCADKQIALEYVQKYNELAGEEMCFLDEDIWLPLKKA